MGVAMPEVDITDIAFGGDVKEFFQTLAVKVLASVTATFVVWAIRSLLELF